MRTNAISLPIEKARGYAVVAVENPVPRPYPFWLWWNLLSLDAPTVAYLWASLFMHALHTPIRDWEMMALVFAVWIIYAGDRILDGLGQQMSAELPERHIFYSRHAGVVLAVLFPLVLLTCWIGLERLDMQARLTGFVMGSFVIGYFLAVHRPANRASRRFPKEIAAGVVFAVGAALPAWMHATESRIVLLPETLLFSGLCVLNCIAIECWEHNRGERRWRQKPYWLVRWADTRIAPIAAILFLCSAWLGIFVSRGGGSASLAAASAISLLIIMAIDWQSHALSRQALRVLADVALLTPLVFLIRWGFELI